MVGALLVLVLGISGCASTGGDIAGGDAELIQLMLSPAEASGWSITPDDGPVDGDSPDCTGAPYVWPDLTTVAHASQFLSHRDETVSVVLKRLDDAAATQVEALRGALAPCARSSSESAHGAMINLVGDDSFAYQTSGSDDLGEYAFSNMLVACGDVMLEVSTISYSFKLNHAALEDLVSPIMKRIDIDEGCSS